ncbi:MAG: helix-turn-helix transcriptional regulator [Bacteroidetes bacterium]|uniref:winged helix-turn-helix transcriptional regulator n=1 Tax=unclassified Chitinophaga TaxID=2619133 RepID=UPI0009D208BF|nr:MULTISPECIES: helix-turn-helix domain-containing protein [unclassified Chitinophaga]MBP1651738.1 helix-turn-helix transcriptional regulator [Bacteroidota bacterium]OMP76138.1 transcriptional regulator [[Flexibacter] sp. ATCC 35208]WPV65347.1 helix-turn-helix domain-containing protein [Chitinophaga sp. LS1]
MGNTAANGHISDECKRHFKAIQDTQDILSGKWKMLIMGILGSGKRRYLELQRLVDGIGPKMLSKELQELEINGLVSRTEMATKPLTVEYALTEYGRSLKPILDDMAEWGKNHRDRVIKDITSLK